jgi:hypothetical protein
MKPVSAFFRSENFRPSGTLHVLLEEAGISFILEINFSLKMKASWKSYPTPQFLNRFCLAFYKCRDV